MARIIVTYQKRLEESHAELLCMMEKVVCDLKIGKKIKYISCLEYIINQGNESEKERSRNEELNPS
jgi:hypothetical protein